LIYSLNHPGAEQYGIDKTLSFFPLMRQFMAKPLLLTQSPVVIR